MCFNQIYFIVLYFNILISICKSKYAFQKHNFFLLNLFLVHYIRVRSKIWHINLFNFLIMNLFYYYKYINKKGEEYGVTYWKLLCKRHQIWRQD